jgi:hypothetical protein
MFCTWNYPFGRADGNHMSNMIDMDNCGLKIEAFTPNLGKCVSREHCIKDVCSTSKNPQSKVICERMHQTVNNVLRTLVHTNPPINMTQAIDDALATAMHPM